MSHPSPVESPIEKDSTLGGSSPNLSATPLPLSYTEGEERRVKWKLNLTVLPLLFLGFYVFQLERGNISNALTDGFMAKVGITQDQFNVGQALLYIGIILGEIPSQYVLQWIGPQVRFLLMPEAVRTDKLGMDFIPGLGVRPRRNSASLPAQLLLLPSHSDPPRPHRMWFHSRLAIHPFHILQA